MAKTGLPVIVGSSLICEFKRSPLSSSLSQDPSFWPYLVSKTYRMQFHNRFLVILSYSGVIRGFLGIGCVSVSNFCGIVGSGNIYNYVNNMF